jgi:hypothetical protein
MKPIVAEYKNSPLFSYLILKIRLSRPALGPTQPPIQWVPGALSLGVKQLGREADHSPPSRAEIKECVELYLHSPIRLHGAMLSLAQGQLHFYRCTIFLTMNPCINVS